MPMDAYVTGRDERKQNFPASTLAANFKEARGKVTQMIYALIAYQPWNAQNTRICRVLTCHCHQ